MKARVFLGNKYKEEDVFYITQLKYKYEFREENVF